MTWTPPFSRWLGRVAPRRKATGVHVEGGFRPEPGTKATEANPLPSVVEEPQIRTAGEPRKGKGEKQKRPERKESHRRPALLRPRSKVSFSSCLPSCFGFPKRRKKSDAAQESSVDGEGKNMDEEEEEAATTGSCQERTSGFLKSEESDGEVSLLPVSTETHRLGEFFASTGASDSQKARQKQDIGGASSSYKDNETKGIYDEEDVEESCPFFQGHGEGSEDEETEWFVHINDGIVTAGLTTLCGGERTTIIMRYYLDEVQSTCEEEIKDEGQELQDAEKLFLEDSQSTDIIDCPRNSSFVHQEGDVPTLLSSRVPEAAALPVYQKRASYGTSACKQVGEVPRDHRSLPGGEVKDKRDPLFESLLCVSSVEMNSVSFPGWLEGTRRSEGTGGGGNIWLGPGRRYSFLGSSLCRLERRVFPKALRFMFTNHSLLACGHPSRVDKFSEKRREGGVVSGKTDLQGSVRKALRDSKEGKGGEQDFLLAPPERFSLRLPGERGDSQKKQEENGEGEEEKRRSTSNRREMQRGRRKRNRKRQRKRKKRSQKS